MSLPETNGVRLGGAASPLALPEPGPPLGPPFVSCGSGEPAGLRGGVAPSQAPQRLPPLFLSPGLPVLPPSAPCWGWACRGVPLNRVGSQVSWRAGGGLLFSLFLGGWEKHVGRFWCLRNPPSRDVSVYLFSDHSLQKAGKERSAPVGPGQPMGTGILVTRGRWQRR